MRIVLFLGAALIGVFGVGCDRSPTPGDKIRVVCTTGMIADLARHIGGDHVEVFALMGPGVDPHRYQPVPDDLNRLRSADLILYNGLHLEGRMGEVFGKFARTKPCFAVTEGIEPARLLTETGGVTDPHLWFDVSLWSEVAGVVAERLAELDPGRSAEYRSNLDTYQRELSELHDFARREIGSIPEERRVLVTAHDAFRYFGRAYDIEVRGIQGMSTEAEASLAEVNALVRFLTERKIRAVFVESSISDRNVRALVEGCRSAGHDLKIGGELYSDAVGEPGTSEGTYAGMVRHNVTTIAEALK